MIHEDCELSEQRRPKIQVRRVYLFLCSLLLFVTLSSCGFHWRGYVSPPLAFHTLYLISNSPYTNFSKALRQSLVAMGIDVRKSPPAPMTLHILSQNFTRTVTSLGNSGQTTTYLLAYTVSFQVLNSTNHILVPPQQIRVLRNFSITSNQLSGDLNTQNSLEDQMKNDAIQQLITRLAAAYLYSQQLDFRQGATQASNRSVQVVHEDLRAE